MVDIFDDSVFVANFGVIFFSTRAHHEVEEGGVTDV
jgi:hypothetical protein